LPLALSVMLQISHLGTSESWNLSCFSVCDSYWIQRIDPTISGPVTSFGNITVSTPSWNPEYYSILDFKQVWRFFFKPRRI